MSVVTKNAATSAAPDAPNGGPAGEPVASSGSAGARFLPRVLTAAAILGGAALVQLGLLLHVRAAGQLPLSSLQMPLTEMPLELKPAQAGGENPANPLALPDRIGQGETWISPGNEELTDAREFIGDEHLKRSYRLAGTPVEAKVWMVFSYFGLDRAHHPEVCYAVADRPEVTGDRAQLAAPGHRAPIQRYRFGGNGFQWVYYWTYEIPPPPSSELTVVQRFYQVNRCRKPSITIEVFVNEVPGFNLETVDRFVLNLDDKIQNFVGSRAVRRSERTPVTVLGGTNRHDEQPKSE